MQIPLRRIEHGASVTPGSSLATALVDRGVTLDMCPTSNVQAATVDTLADHPIVALHRQGLTVTISTDAAFAEDDVRRQVADRLDRWQSMVHDVAG